MWGDPDPVRGNEQSGRRPLVAVSSQDYLETVTALALVVPVTAVYRRWPNHVRLHGAHGLGRPSWAMTEQVRAVTRTRLVRPAGMVDGETMTAISTYLRDFLDP